MGNHKYLWKLHMIWNYKDLYNQWSRWAALHFFYSLLKQVCINTTTFGAREGPDGVWTLVWSKEYRAPNTWLSPDLRFCGLCITLAMPFFCLLFSATFMKWPTRAYRIGPPCLNYRLHDLWVFCSNYQMWAHMSSVGSNEQWPNIS